MRRVFISQTEQVDDKLVGKVDGLAGEQFNAEIYQPYGLSANPEDGGESVLLEINGDPDNYVALPAGSTRVAKPGETLIYHGDSLITLTKDDIKIEVGGHFFTLKDDKINTDMDINTSGTVRAKTLFVNGSNYSNHRHGGVRNGGGVTGGVTL